MLSALTSVKVQIPLAAAILLTLFAAILLSLTVGAVIPHTVLVGLLAIVPTSLLAMRLLFLRTRKRWVAYTLAFLWPPVLGGAIGPLLVVYMRAIRPNADYSFGGAPVIDVGAAWPLCVAIGAAIASGLVGILLVLLVWMISRAERRRATFWAWGYVGVLAIVALPFERAVGTAGLACAVVALALQVVQWRRERVQLMPSIGPYRSA